MKNLGKNLRLTGHCDIEIYRDGSFVGNGLFIRRAGISGMAEKQSRIINENGAIEFIPTRQIIRVGGAL